MPFYCVGIVAQLSIIVISALKWSTKITDVRKMLINNGTYVPTRVYINEIRSVKNDTIDFQLFVNWFDIERPHTHTLWFLIKCAAIDWFLWLPNVAVLWRNAFSVHAKFKFHVNYNKTKYKKKRNGTFGMETYCSFGFWLVCVPCHAVCGHCAPCTNIKHTTLTSCLVFVAVAAVLVTAQIIIIRLYHHTLPIFYAGIVSLFFSHFFFRAFFVSVCRDGVTFVHDIHIQSKNQHTTIISIEEK